MTPTQILIVATVAAIILATVAAIAEQWHQTND